MKLRGQLAVTLIPTVMVPLLVFGWLASDYLVDSRRQASRNEMDTLLQQIETNARTHMAAIHANLDSFARSNLVTGYLAVEEAATRYAVFQSPLLRLFADYASVFPEYYEFRILMADGSEDARYATGNLVNQTDEEGSTPYFQGMKDNPSDFYTEFIVHPDNGQPALLASKRLTVQTATRAGLGKEPLQAYLALTIRPDFLTTQIQPLHLGLRGFAFVADADGRILIGPSWRTLPARLATHDWTALRALATERRFELVTWMDTSFLVKGIALSNSLYLFTVADDAELTDGIQTLHLEILGITMVAFLLLFPLLYGILQHQFVLPLLHLSRASQEVGRGHFVMAPLPDSGRNRHNELGSLMVAFQRMVADLGRLHAALRQHAEELEEKVAERTAELHLKNEALQTSLTVIADANKKIQDSIQYAQRIQSSLLPDWTPLQALLPDSFVLWEPRDVVGGDIYFADVQHDTILLALLDCTGHGVPGAFMTMIAASGLQRIVRDEQVRQPAAILQALNMIVKTTLHQDSRQARSNDGLDAGILAIDLRSRQMQYAGARISLIMVQDGNLQTIRGAGQSIGYPDSPWEQTYTVHTLAAAAGMVCYLTTDGLLDQLGGPKGLALGSRRLHALLQAHAALPMAEQQERLTAFLRAYQGDMERMDDVTVLGFRLPGGAEDGI
ncbi:MAG: SpoIIE family protein phosphatase [Magnetococcus sp. DMHC-8]